MNVPKRLRDLILDMDKPLFFVTTALFVFGLLNIVTASSQASVLKYNTSLYNFFLQTIILFNKWIYYVFIFIEATY